MAGPNVSFSAPTPVVNGNGNTNGHVQVTSDRLIVGVDFGTTYSGVAAAYSANPDDIEIIKTWPGGNGITSDKVPTEIAYETAELSTPLNNKITPEQGGAKATVQKIKWGFQFKPEEPRLRCIKLFLDRNQKLPHFVSPLDTAAHLRSCDRTVMHAVSDYLGQIYTHTMETLNRRYGDSFMAITKVEFVLTVPAVWSDSAKNATLQAAEKAGMGKKHELRLVSEPEAAMLHALKTVQPHNLKVNDNFVVCDAGGGTVDCIGYKITQLSPLRVEESAVGTGGLCGSAFLNYRFEEHVKNRLGVEKYTYMRNKKPKTWMMGLKYFEEFVKRNYNEEDGQEVNVPFPGLADNEEAGVDSGFMVMSTAQVKEIFDPVIEEVVKLLDGQVDAIRAKSDTVSGIILVGGFGQSNHLYNRLKTHFNTPAQLPAYGKEKEQGKISEQQNQCPPIEVIQPLYAWTAVVRGAVIRGLDDSMVSSRRSRLHYGTSYATVYDETQHDTADRYWSPLWERWMVSDRMQWHISKGTAISPSTPISFHYTRNFTPYGSLIVTDELIACGSSSAPPSRTKTLSTVCTLTTDLAAVPEELFTRLKTSKGVEFRNLDFELAMRIQSADLVFELRVGGVRYGEVKAEFH
ncbi:actin-like ATPase domain-containing protein [Aureobasidium subglaciale]|nr:actin-like ATPase domain-containing protein [Aureobasidium subglaciale]